MKTIEVSEISRQSEKDTLETTDNRNYSDAGGAHGSQNNNRASLGKEPLNEEQRQATREVLATESKIMDDGKKNYLTNNFDTLSKPAQKRILEFSELSAEHQKLALDMLNSATTKETIASDIAPKLPRLNDGSYQTLPPYTRMGNDELKDFVKENWGQFLKAFNSDLTADAITRTELRNYDKRLMNRLDKLSSNELLEIIQKEDRSAEYKANPPTKAEIKKAYKIISFLRNHPPEETLTI